MSHASHTLFLYLQVWPDRPNVTVDESLDWDTQVEVRLLCPTLPAAPIEPPVHVFVFVSETDPSLTWLFSCASDVPSCTEPTPRSPTSSATAQPRGGFRKSRTSTRRP